MALVYESGVNEIDDPTYTRFLAWFGALDEATRLAFADRLAERARLLRKAILNTSVVSDADDNFAANESPGTTDPASPAMVTSWQNNVVPDAAVDCFKAANNDI